MGIDGIGNSFTERVGTIVVASRLRTQDAVDTASAAPSETSQMATATVAAPPAPSTSSLMAGNFVDTNTAESRYIAARKAAFQSDSNMTNRQNAVLAVTVAEMALMTASGMSASTAQYLAGVKSQRRMREEQRASTTEVAESNLDEMKKDIEQKAQDATRQDPEGNSRAESTEEAASPGTASGQTVSPAAPLPAPPASTAPTTPTGAQTGAETETGATPDNSTPLAAESAAAAVTTNVSAMSIDITV